MFLSGAAVSQTKWFNPEKEGATIHGRAYDNESREGYYQRFPKRAEQLVPEWVWGLSKNSAGSYIRFYSNAPSIVVRYGVEGAFAMPHMPATGVSGVDLYAYNCDGKELWLGGRSHFADTVLYRFDPISISGSVPEQPKYGNEFVLFLPLYNTVKWMEIGVADSCFVSFIDKSASKPIVVYGTSIAHGACASRPGMAWPSIVQRKLREEVVNLGFSGSAMLEPGVVGLVAEVDARMYVIDCLPNLFTLDPAEQTKRLVAAVKQIRAANSEAPILLADHLGYPHGSAIDGWSKKASDSNMAQKLAYDILVKEGVKGIYHLTYNEIGMPQDATVEGIHPSDYGMQVYSDAYLKKIRSILNMPEGVSSTTKAVTQRREPDSYGWRERHDSLLLVAKEGKYRNVILGNSLMHKWGGYKCEPNCVGFNYGVDSWAKYIEPLSVMNMGMGWDRIENVLWRVYDGALDGFSADNIVTAIGTNNFDISTNQEIVDGLSQLVDAVKSCQPGADITLFGIMPRVNSEKRVADLNLQIAAMAKLKGIKFADVSSVLLLPSGKIDERCFLRDRLHLSAAGYNNIAPFFAEALK